MRDAGSTTVEYYNLQGVKLTGPARGLVVKVTTYPDGTKESQKIIVE